MDGESLFCSNVNHMRFLSLHILRGGASYIFFAASAASCTREFFACLSTLGREETEKESLVTFFSVSLLSSWASKHLFVKPSVAQFWLFVRLHVLPPPHSQSNCAFVEASQGSRELDYSVIQLYFRWSCDELRMEGALDTKLNRCSANSAICF